jgi:uncharacterized protein
MTMTVRDHPEASRYEAVDESGVVAGFVDYVDHRGNRVLVHTQVDDAFEGRGVGGTLARASLDQSLATGLHVVVSCPFITVWVGKHPEYADKVTLR